MGVGDTLTTIAERFIDPVKRTGSPAGRTGIEEVLARHARLIQGTERASGLDRAADRQEAAGSGVTSFKNDLNVFYSIH